MTTPEITCDVEYAIRLIGGKWKMLVLRVLLLRGPLRYAEIRTQIGGISEKELSRNLRELQRDRLVEGGGTHAYALTPAAATLHPAFRSLADAGKALRPPPPLGPEAR